MILLNCHSNDIFFQNDILQTLLKILGGAQEALLVGGAVRNMLLGLPVEDVDIATIHRPEEVIRRFEKTEFLVVPIGFSHGTILLRHPQTLLSFEVTTLRKDVHTDGRHAEVIFGSSFEEDARRRDFTLNALYCDGEGNLYDPLGGYEDLRAQKVRFIGNPVDRIREDHLRILRFFRFSAFYGKGALDSSGLHACKLWGACLYRLSHERVRGELLKLILATMPQEALVAMEQCDIFRILTPKVKCLNLTALTEMLSCDRAYSFLPSAFLRWVALFSLPFPTVFSCFSLTRAEKERLGLYRTLMHFSQDFSEPFYKALYENGSEKITEGLRLKWALQEKRSLSLGDKAEWFAKVQEISKTPLPRFPITGYDLLEHGVAPGPEMGRVLNCLKSVWFASAFKKSKAEILLSLPLFLPKVL